MSLKKKNKKSAVAFRTISEVSEELKLPQHVLRFWESKFTQIKPLKRGGRRRFYRPGDLAVLKRIQNLLHNEGYTIKGVQRLLKEGDNTAESSFVDQEKRAELNSVLVDLNEIQKILS